MKSDVWSLGVILFEMYSGQPLYHTGTDPDDILLAIKKTSPAKIINDMKETNFGENSTRADFDLFQDLLHSCLESDVNKRIDIETVVEHEFWKGKTRQKSADQMKRKILSESINLQNSVLEPSHLKSSFRNTYNI